MNSTLVNSPSKFSLRNKQPLAFGLFLVILATLFFTAFNYSNIGIGLIEAFDLLSHYYRGDSLSPTQQSYAAVLFEIRLPRLLVAAFCGAALSCAGVLAQGVFRNPLASPSLLGVESGAGLFAAIAFYHGVAHFNQFTVPAAALLGALATTGLILFLAMRFPHWPIESLLLAGFALNSLQVAITSGVVAMILEEHQQGSAVLQWMLGSFSGRGFEHLAMGLPLFIVGLIVSLPLLNRLDALSLGEDVASTLSIDVPKLRRQAILGISLLVAGAVAVAGSIPFVSLVIPHFTRILVGPKHGRLMVSSAINGMSLMIAADLIARTFRPPGEIEVGVVTSIIGTPLFLLLLLQRGRR